MMTPYEKGRYTIAEGIITESMHSGEFQFGDADDVTLLFIVAADVFRHLDPEDTKPFGVWLWQRVRLDLVGFLLQMKEWLDFADAEGTLTDEWFEAHGHPGVEDDPEETRGLIQDFRTDFQAILESAVINKRMI